MKKIVLITGLIIIISVPVLCADPPGISELNNASSEIRKFYNPMYNFALIISGICGIVGAIRIYNNWQMGKQKITSEVVGWFSAGIFISILGVAVKGLFY